MLMAIKLDSLVGALIDRHGNLLRSTIGRDYRNLMRRVAFIGYSERGIEDTQFVEPCRNLSVMVGVGAKYLMLKHIGNRDHRVAQRYSGFIVHGQDIGPVD